MKTNKIIIYVIGFIVLLLNWKGIVNFIISFPVSIVPNMEFAENRHFSVFIIVTLLYWLEIVFLFLVYDIVLLMLTTFTTWKLTNYGQNLVIKKKIQLVFKIIRLNYYFSRLSNILRLGWVSYSFGNEGGNIVWLELSKKFLSQNLLSIFKLFIKLPMLLAILLTCFSLKLVNNIIIINYLYIAKDSLLNILKANISVLFSHISLFITLISVIPVLFFFYFYSQKREVRKIIDNKNAECLKEVVLLHEKMLIWFNQHIYRICKNYNYVINCQEAIVQLFLEKMRKSDSLEVGDSQSIEEFNFIELDDTEMLQEIAKELCSERLKNVSESFSKKRYDWRRFNFKYLYSFQELEEIEKFFYTKKGISLSINIEDQYHNHELKKAEIERYKENTTEMLASDIYKKLVFLYELKRMTNSLEKYLYSTSHERIIINIFNKKQ